MRADFCNDLRHNPRQHLDHIRVHTLRLSSDTLKSNGINDKKTHDCEQPQFPCLFDDSRLGGDHTVGLCGILQKIHGNLPAAQTSDEVNMYQNRLAALFQTLYNISDITDIPIEHKDDL